MEQPIDCPLCERIFADRAKLMKHASRSHKGLVDRRTLVLNIKSPTKNKRVNLRKLGLAFRKSKNAAINYMVSIGREAFTNGGIEAFEQTNAKSFKNTPNQECYELAALMTDELEGFNMSYKQWAYANAISAYDSWHKKAMDSIEDYLEYKERYDNASRRVKRRMRIRPHPIFDSNPTEKNSRKIGVYIEEAGYKKGKPAHFDWYGSDFTTNSVQGFWMSCLGGKTGKKADKIVRLTLEQDGAINHALDLLSQGYSWDGQAKIYITKKGDFELHRSVAKIMEVPKPSEITHVVGVDMGAKVMFASTDLSLDGKIISQKYHGLEVAERIKKLEQRRKKLQRRHKKEGGRAKALQRSANKIQNARKTVMYQEANKLIDNAEGGMLVHEILNMKGGVRRGTFGKGARKAINSFPAASLQSAIHSASLRKGIRAQGLGAAYSSQDCPNCGNRDKYNTNTKAYRCYYHNYVSNSEGVCPHNHRKEKILEEITRPKKEMNCTKCGHTLNRDRSASHNMALRGIAWGAEKQKGRYIDPSNVKITTGGYETAKKHILGRMPTSRKKEVVVQNPKKQTGNEGSHKPNLSKVVSCIPQTVRVIHDRQQMNVAQMSRQQDVDVVKVTHSDNHDGSVTLGESEEAQQPKSIKEVKCECERNGGTTLPLCDFNTKTQSLRD